MEIPRAEGSYLGFKIAAELAGCWSGGFSSVNIY